MKIYVISDTHIQNRYSHHELARFAKEAQADYFQFREKCFDFQKHFDELKKIKDLLKGSKTQLIINDNLELALEIQADGVHVGQEDISLDDIFSAHLPVNFVVGATVHNIQELKNAEKYPVNYLGVGPVFGTHSKEMHLPPLGIEGLKRIQSQTTIPIFAIGNIQLHNYRELQGTGIEGIVLLSAFVLSDNPVDTIHKFRKL